MQLWHNRLGLLARSGKMSLLGLALGAGAPLAGCSSEELGSSNTEQVSSLEPEGSIKGSGSGPARPNILLIIADDVGAEAVSLYPDLVGQRGAVPLPNPEALAENGLV